MRARTGKIARLPEPIREQLNQLLLDGTLAKNTVPWLNQLPEVQQVLATYFHGRPITEHNISEWHRGGYQDWLRARETRARIVHLTEKYAHLESEGRLTRRVESVVVAEMMDAMNELHKIEDFDLRSKKLHHLCRDLARLQNARSRGLELALQQAKQRPDPAAPVAARPRTLGATRTC